MKESEKKQEPNAPTSKTDRKPYQSPTLTEYGPIAKLTMGRLGSYSDGARRQSKPK